jgi:nitroimidazol reductase NimA-like FMN-containing flavoprotein (pyridoxamine 5'-phosphate oxidase superfamily)
MNSIVRPIFRHLDESECLELLARNNVGRVAYARKNHIDIEPVHYVYSDRWIYGRTSQGKKLEMTGYSWWPVAFEVDEVEDLFRWRSVVVHGGFYAMQSGGTEPEVEEWRRAVELLRTLIPGTLREDDPTSFRDILFRIAVQEVTGREALPGPPGTGAD